MKLTVEQRSEIISEMASSEAGFNELMRVLLDSVESTGKCKIRLFF